jgi:hypothetical protein
MKSALYLLDDPDTRIQNFHFVGNCRKRAPRKSVEFISGYSDSRGGISYSLVGNVANLLPTKFFYEDHRHFLPTPILGLYVQYRNIAVLFPPLARLYFWLVSSFCFTRLDLVAFNDRVWCGEHSGPFASKKIAIYADISISKEVIIFIWDRKSKVHSRLVMLKMPRIVRSCNLHASCFKTLFGRGRMVYTNKMKYKLL